MEKYGFTEREQRVYGPHKDTVIENTPVSVTIVALILAVLIVHFLVEPHIQDIATFLATPIPVHAQVPESDRAEETRYCKAWNTNQTRIVGADNMQIATHCAPYL
jgi:ABC-type Fe3+ transport system substrate-binding protein